MNIIRTIENTTLLTVGALCAVAIISILLHSADSYVGNTVNLASTPVTQLPAAVNVGKRLSSTEATNTGAQHAAG